MAYTPTINTKGYWKLDGNSLDSSGLGNNGTDTAITYVAGREGQAASFNGTSSKILTNVFPSGSLTINVWIYLNNTTSARYITADWSYNYRNFLLVVSGNTIRCLGGNGSTSSGGDIIGGTLVENTWYLITATRSGGTITIYINGEQVATSTIAYTGGATSNNKYIGTSHNSVADDTFNGLIDEVIIEDRAWSATEVRNYYSSFYTANAVGRTRYRDELGQVDSVGAFA